MTLPYYSEKKWHKDISHIRAQVLLLFPDMVEKIGHVVSRPFAFMPMQYLASITFSCNIASEKRLTISEKIYDGAYIWKKIIEIYVEIFRLVVELGKLDELHEIYVRCMEKIMEGQEHLHHCDEQLTSIGDGKIQVQIKGLMDKYHAIYESNVRHTINMPIYCLDVIKGNNNIQNIEKYFTDDLSHKLKKIRKCRDMAFMNDIKFLELGIEQHVRNSIGHDDFEYGEQNSVIFKDRTWRQSYSIWKLKNLTDVLETNFYAQVSALLIFIHEYHDKIRYKYIKIGNTKQLRSILFQELINLHFEPQDIAIDENNKEITCTVQKGSGFDYNTPMFAQLKGVKFSMDLPALKAEDQIFNFLRRIGLYKTDFEHCIIRIVDYQDKEVTVAKANLKSITEKLKDAVDANIEEDFTITQSN